MFRSKSALIRVLGLFCVGILAPTGFLVYLGVQSIRTENNLLERDASERLGRTAEAMRAQAQTVLTDLLRASDVPFSISVDATGKLLRPILEVSRQPRRASPMLPPDLRSELRRAEEAEFQKHDYTTALAAYQTLAEKADPPLRPGFLISAAGALTHLHEFAKAESLYQEVLARYGKERDAQGYPFSLVVASQLSELQAARGRTDLASAQHGQILTDLLAGRWALAWDEEQFFARRLTEAMQRWPPSGDAGFRTLKERWDTRVAAADAARRWRDRY